MGSARVEFDGGRTAEAGLTWGQRAIWEAIRRTAPGDHYFNFARVFTVPRRAAPITTERAVRMLGALIERHESLRTRIRDVRGEPRQFVARVGELEVTLSEGPPEDAAERVERASANLAAVAFDYAEEWPVRAALVTSEGVVSHVVLVFCHLAADGDGAHILERDYRMLLLKGRILGEAPRPVELARRQRTAVGARSGRAALDHWERQYRRIPSTMFAEPAGTSTSPRFRRALLTSRAVALAVPAIARRHRVSGSCVLLTAAATLVTTMTGLRRCAMHTIASNRSRRGDRDMVTTLSQEGLFVVDVDTATFDELLPTAWQASLRAYRYARYDPCELERTLARVGEERGTSIHPYCCFNDMRPDGADDGIRTLEDPHAATADTTLTWPDGFDHVSCRFCLHVRATTDGLGVSLTADTRYLPPERMERYLRGLEALLVESVVREVTVAEVPALMDRCPTPVTP